VSSRMNHPDTAHWVTVYRSEESKRPDSLFRDPLANGLAGERGKAIVDSLRDASQSWTFVVRTFLIDRILQAAVWEGEVDTVLNLGAGLDARPYRLRLPETLRWVEVDLPEVIEEKSALLANEIPSCHVERRGFDLYEEHARRALLESICKDSRSCLVLTEGLLVYLAPWFVRRLSDELRERSCFRYWVTDISPAGLAARVAASGLGPPDSAVAAYRFVPPGGSSYFDGLGWGVQASWSTIQEAIAVGRAPEHIANLQLDPEAAGVDQAGGVLMLERR
jgi:methyltransferase (TIGR00027 family)